MAKMVKILSSTRAMIGEINAAGSEIHEHGTSRRGAGT